MSKDFRFLENLGGDMSAQGLAARYTLIEAQTATDPQLTLELHYRDILSTDEKELYAKMTLLVDMDDDEEQKVSLGWLYSPVDNGPYDGWVIDIYDAEFGTSSSSGDYWQKSGRPFNSSTFMDGQAYVEQDIEENRGDAETSLQWELVDEDSNFGSDYGIDCPDSAAADQRCTVYASFKRSFSSADP